MKTIKKEAMAKKIAKSIVQVDPGQVAKQIIHQALDAKTVNPEKLAFAISWVISDMSATAHALAAIFPQELREEVLAPIMPCAISCAQKKTGHLGAMGQIVDFDFSEHPSFEEWKKARASE